ncbi:MAG: hypothetical protein RDV41_05240, partial [Planctomycetota bacterium]|nr:hypothetical protein [Planctomycetota bacterium]
LDETCARLEVLLFRQSLSKSLFHYTVGFNFFMIFGVLGALCVLADCRALALEGSLRFSTQE